MTGHMRGDARKRQDETSATEAEAARAAQILGASEWVGGGAEVIVPTPLCSVCQGAVNGFVCGPCERDGAGSLVSLDCPVCGEVMHGGRCVK